MALKLASLATTEFPLRWHSRGKRAPHVQGPAGCWNSPWGHRPLATWRCTAGQPRITEAHDGLRPSLHTPPLSCTRCCSATAPNLAPRALTEPRLFVPEFSETKKTAEALTEFMGPILQGDVYLQLPLKSAETKSADHLSGAAPDHAGMAQTTGEVS